MASKSLAAVVEETSLSSPQIAFDSINLNFYVSGRDVSTGEPKTFTFNDSVGLNLNDDAELNKTLSDKPYLLEVIPKLVQRALQSYDAENAKAKQLKDELSALLGV